ncbi:Gamma-glutamyltranspeptidase precursor [Rodentibacter pneumotropicus]|uniref:Gamma-glutamyltranspeptidase n=1 Tax=Rodentibacter pneumotropicus TaxID=758 RepID=A0A448MIU8_9PAST|nr:Gamma-glutamyltranspeptidase precursor [Rodentibacter pneumotropicus]
MPLHKVLEPAIKLAEEGFPISQTLANLLDTEKEVLGKWQSSRKIFFKTTAL